MRTIRLLRSMLVAMAVLVGLLVSLPAAAHSPVIDSDLSDWCAGTQTYRDGRVEDTVAELNCGHCAVSTFVACVDDGDCPEQTCVNLGSKTETVWWDDRTDAAVNDFATLAVTSDASHLYFGTQFWTAIDPLSMPFFQIALDHDGGGIDRWHDPRGLMAEPGTCSGFTDRLCTVDEDCHFCPVSTEPPPSTRVRACGSGCNPDIGETCDTTQTCLGIGTASIDGLGAGAGPPSGADRLLLFDLSFWLLAAGDSAILMEPGTAIDATSPWDPVTGCAPDFEGDNTYCDFPIIVNPSASGGPGGPPSTLEVQIPWSAFGCTGCPAACSCPGLGPGVPFRFNMTIVRGALMLDFRPAGAHEDVMSEPAAGASTTSRNDCAGPGSTRISCELGDGSADAYVPRNPPLDYELTPGGRTYELTVRKNLDDYTLDWFGSCSAGDTDYAIYEGMLGSWTSHVPVPGGCSTGGATTANVSDSGFDAYYLIVATDGLTEGSYGENTASGERPVSASPCRAQSLGGCP